MTPTQADRDRAASLCDSESFAAPFRNGILDDNNIVQAFARHAWAAREEALEQAASEIERYGEINMEACGDNILMDPLLGGREWSPENVAISQDCSIMSTIHSAKYHACQEVAANVRALKLPASDEGGAG